ncbi:Hpt domain-containing protein [Paucibacter sp. Y2R2-4]|uniref:hybrid sensor histidine kinase/response regulator n=1 Tax=Paucibacter sp. Y2R2-4 TaxID=2893553 RepID=UPI0021E44F38|nr:Hpt domain-containing protein [Paucibacter sp. Y2R2-4]MCV2349812.1 Hpt domain-containing protein [Paucibacter sp. Y2R2-4]
MDFSRDSEFPPDLSPLAWVQEELRRSLESVHKSMRRLLRDGDTRTTVAAALGSDVSGSPAMQAAAAQLHQVAGVLSLVGLPAGARVLGAAEQAVAYLAQNPQEIDLKRVETIERADFALLSLIARMLAGNKASPLSLFPTYRELQTLNGAERIHPADLWEQPWSWRTLPPDAQAQAMAHAVVRGPFEATLLKAMREPSAAHARSLSDLCASLAAGLNGPNSRTLWQLASAVFESQALGLLTVDSFVKRLGSRLLSQLRAVAQGDAGVNDRLAHDLLFFCAQSRAPAAGQAALRLQAALAAYGLAEAGTVEPGDYEDETLGRIDPAWVSQARRRVSSAKESWSSAAEGDSARIGALNEQFVALAESLQKLFPSGEVLAEALQRAVVATLRSGAAPAPALAMEVATSLLYVDAALDDAAFDQPEQAERVRRLAGRIEAVQHGEAPEPLEAWMEDLYRRVSDRQTLGSVVQELRSNLSEVERQADEYFRDPGQRERLIPVPAQLSAMRGVLTVLGLDQAALACLRMRDEVDELANTEVDVARGGARELFDRLANNLGALGFLIDMLSVQPQLAKRMFVFDEASGRLNPVMGRRSDATQLPPLDPAVVAAHTAPPAMPSGLAEPPQLLQPMDELDLPVLELPSVQAALPLPEIDQVPAPVAAPLPPPLEVPAPKPSLVPQMASATDPEMQEIFLEEAGEVLATASRALAALRMNAQDKEQMTVLRRAFHTLKGSARMVGFDAFGEGAWACEQLFNARLGEAAPQADPSLLAFSAEALIYLGDWCEQIAGRQPGVHVPDPLRRSADALRLAGTALPIEWPATTIDLPPTVFSGELHDSSEPAEAVPPTLELLHLDDMGPAEAPMDAPAVEELPELVEDLDLPAHAEPLEMEASPPEIVPLDQAEEDLGFDLELPLLPAEPVSAPVADFELPEFELRLDLGEVIEAAEPEAEATSLALTEAETEAADLPALTELPELPELSAEPQTPALPSATIIELHRPQLHPESVDLQALEPALHEELLDETIDETIDEQFKMIGPLPVKLELFNIFLNEADELSRRLATQLAEWALELNRPVPASCEALAHALAGSAAAVRFEDLSTLNRALEHALGRAQRAGRYSEADAQLFVLAADEVRHLLHQFAAGFLKSLNPATLASLQAYTPDLNPSSQFGALDDGLGGFDEPRSFSERERDAAAVEPASAVLLSADADEVEPGLPDEIDPVLLPIFEEEARDLLRDLHGALRAWLGAASDQRHGDACMRALHTFKGGARLTGAMRLGEQAHALESAIERAMAGTPSVGDLQALQVGADALEASLDQLLNAPPQSAAVSAPAVAIEPVPELVAELVAEVATTAPLVHELPELLEVPEVQEAVEVQELPPAPDLLAVDEPVSEALPLHEEPVLATLASEATEIPAAIEADAPLEMPQVFAAPAEASGPQIDWARFAEPPLDGNADTMPSGLQALVRVRASLLERMAAQAGEVSIRRSRLESELAQMKGSLLDLDDNLDRLRAQLRELELQAEAQMGAQQEQQFKANQARSADFDPLEFDRYTRFQELTRMLAESVGDVATVQRSLQRNVQLGEDELAAQSRLTRELQDDLLRTRMVEFESLAERLHRVVRQAARDAGRQAKLELVGSQTELDRSVLERMSGAFEHLLRNSVSHGIEAPEQRLAAGKDAVGTIRVQVRQEGNEVLLNFSDDGAGLNLARIRERGLQLGLIKPEIEAHTPISDAALMQLIFTPGFSTAAQVTELSGRGVGMDVVRAEVSTLGGSIETSSAAGQGTQFALRLPLTTALTQVVLLRCGEQSVAVPASLMDSVQRVPLDQVEAAYAGGSLDYAGEALPFYWLGGLLGQTGRGHAHGKHASVVLVRTAHQRMALHVDEVLGNQEVVVKNLGPQLSRVPGLAGISLLASGEVALIYNPVALASWYGAAAQAQLRELSLAAQSQAQALQSAQDAEETLAPLVLVVDDSLTVRRVTQRLLEREGYRVQLAKDGLDAMEQLAGEELPDLVLSDIEMPRMDGFDLVRNMRADARLAGLPVIMITSRIAQKHRDYAEQLGVNHYLGKPYDEEQLLSLIAGYTSAQIAAEVLRP